MNGGAAPDLLANLESRSKRSHNTPLSRTLGNPLPHKRALRMLELQGASGGDSITPPRTPVLCWGDITMAPSVGSVFEENASRARLAVCV